MKSERGILAKRARYISDMCELLAQRADAYETAVDEHGTNSVYCGYDVNQTNSKENVRRMIVQLRAELLEMGRML